MYLDMGPNRSLASVAAKMGRSKTRMEQLSRKFGWPERVAARDAHLAELERQAIERLACEKAVEWWQLHEPARRQDGEDEQPQSTMPGHEVPLPVR